MNSSFIIIIVIVVIMIVGIPLYKKFVVPKLMNKMAGEQAEADKEFEEHKDEIMAEFLSNTDKFGLLTTALQGQKLYGIVNGRLDEKIKLSNHLKERLISSITLTEKVDMNLGFLAAAEDGLHYMIFDGQRCIINDVFDYDEIKNQKFTKKLYTFEYKGEQLKFDVAETLQFYPRFNVHEVVASGSGQGGLRTINSFVREWLAWDITDNVEYNSRVLMKPKMGKFVQKKEFFIDYNIRKILFDGFLKKMNIKVQAQ